MSDTMEQKPMNQKPASQKQDRISPEQRAEIDEQKAQRYDTRRATVPALEDILYEPIPLLDHGFVRVIDYMGDIALIKRPI